VSVVMPLSSVCRISRSVIYHYLVCSKKLSYQETISIDQDVPAVEATFVERPEVACYSWVLPIGSV
ncbi:MAG: hypothetical protein V7713_11435, partial [Marinobacter sp.]